MAFPLAPWDRSPRSPAGRSPFPVIVEVTGDSDDATDQITAIACGSGTPYAIAVDDRDADSDDAHSCSHESCYVAGLENITRRRRKEIDDDDDEEEEEEEEGEGSEDKDDCADCWSAPRKLGFQERVLGAAPMEKEGRERSVEVVKGDRDRLRRMEDKLFWETCLAIGYP